MSEWSHLPNSHHIDWVIESLKRNPELWTKACITRNNAFGLYSKNNNWTDIDGFEIWDVLDESRDIAWINIKENIEKFAIWFTKYSVGGKASDTAWDAILALIAYNDCDQYINMGYEKLQFYAIFSEKPQAICYYQWFMYRKKLNERMVTLT